MTPLESRPASEAGGVRIRRLVSWQPKDGQSSPVPLEVLVAMARSEGATVEERADGSLRISYLKRIVFTWPAEEVDAMRVPR